MDDMKKYQVIYTTRTNANGKLAYVEAENKGEVKQKLREALEEADTVLSALGYDANTPIRTQIKQALAEPPKNCDVGTADEQIERFEDFCLKHIGCAEETGGRHCVGCPLEKASMKTTQKCELYWAQMPYEEDEVKI
jgi:hypothetical protein